MKNQNQNQIKLGLIRKSLEKILKEESPIYCAERAMFTNPDIVKTYLRAQLENEQREVFAVLFLDNQHGLINFEKMFYGTINASPVFPREIIKRALLLNAASVIVCHNHPSGILEPSSADMNIKNQQ